MGVLKPLLVACRHVWGPVALFKLTLSYRGQYTPSLNTLSKPSIGKPSIYLYFPRVDCGFCMIYNTITSTIFIYIIKRKQQSKSSLYILHSFFSSVCHPQIARVAPSNWQLTMYDLMVLLLPYLPLNNNNSIFVPFCGGNIPCFTQTFFCLFLRLLRIWKNIANAINQVNEFDMTRQTILVYVGQRTNQYFGKKMGCNT